MGQAIVPKPKNTMPLQLGAMWNDQVSLPLAKASERLSRAQPDLDGAPPLLDDALRGIRLVKAATPADDQNFIRIQILERRVEGVRDLVAEQRGHPMLIEKEMIRLRAEAATLGPELKYAPRFAGDPEVAESGQSQPPQQPTSKGAIDEYWQSGVIGNMWRAQQLAQDNPGLAVQISSYAASYIVRFRNAIPENEPATRLKLNLLYDGLDTIIAIFEARGGTADPTRLRDAAIDTYNTAEVVGKYITGQSVNDDEATEKIDPNEEPSFTWERERPPFKDDTALERPEESAAIR